MNKQLTARYLGSYGGGYKFEDNSKALIIFKRCDMDLVREFGLWTDMSVNQLFNIEYVYFNKDVNNKIIENMSLI